MKLASRWHLFLVSGVALASLLSNAPLQPLEPTTGAPWRPTAVEHDTGGFVLYQPMNDADGQVAGTAHTQNSKTYPVTTTRWLAVGFLRVEPSDDPNVAVEHWYMSVGDADTTVTSSPVGFVGKYFWAGRSSPAQDKHTDWNDLPMRFVRRNDLSGTADLAEFISEVATVYGFALEASAGKFMRYDHSCTKAAGY